MGYMALLSENLPVVKRSTVGRAQKAMAVLTILSLFLNKRIARQKGQSFFHSGKISIP